MNKHSFIALIPARGGSKGLKKKNIFPIHEKPLISWTIESANTSKCIDQTFVSSDDEVILEIASNQGVNCIVRPKDLAEDSSSMESVIIDFIKQINDKAIEFKYLVLLQPTSPLRDRNDIEEACKIFLRLKADSLISVTKTDSSVFKTLILNKDGFLKAAFKDNFPSMNRQELPTAYKPNGAIYIIDKDLFVNNPTFFQKKTVMYEMDAKRSIDVDSIEDIRIIEEQNLL